MISRLERFLKLLLFDFPIKIEIYYLLKVKFYILCTLSITFYTQDDKLVKL